MDYLLITQHLHTRKHFRMTFVELSVCGNKPHGIHNECITYKKRNKK